MTAAVAKKRPRGEGIPFNWVCIRCNKVQTHQDGMGRWKGHRACYECKTPTRPRIR